MLKVNDELYVSVYNLLRHDRQMHIDDGGLIVLGRPNNGNRVSESQFDRDSLGGLLVNPDLSDSVLAVLEDVQGYPATRGGDGRGTVDEVLSSMSLDRAESPVETDPGG